MRISVVIPAYNVERYVEQCIESVLEQTFPASEIVVVDDGSKDKTADLAARFGPPVQLIRQANSGVAVARNHALSRCTGDYVAFLDADDYWLPNRLELQVRAVEKDPALDLVYGDYWLEFPDGRRELKPVIDPESLIDALRLANQFPPSSILVRRSLLGDAPFDTNLNGSEDWALMLRLAVRGKFLRQQEPATVYRVLPGSLSTKTDRMLRDALAMLDSYLLEGLSGPERLAWRRRILATIYERAAISARVDQRYEDASRFLLESLRAKPSPVFRKQRYKMLLNMIYRGHFHRSALAVLSTPNDPPAPSDGGESKRSTAVSSRAS